MNNTTLCHDISYNVTKSLCIITYTRELAHAAQIPRPTESKYHSKLAVITKYNLHQKELTAEHETST